MLPWAFFAVSLVRDERTEDRTVAEILKQAGYTTGIIGKWGLGEAGSTGIPNQKGFDSWFGYLNQAHAHNYYPDFLWRNQTRVSLPNVVPPAGKREFGSGVATKRTGGGSFAACAPKSVARANSAMFIGPRIA